MMFAHLNEWSIVRLRVFYAIFCIIYFGLILVAPTIVISIKYNLFVTSESVGKLSGMGMIVAMVVGIIAITQFKKVVNKLGEETPNQQVLKYTLLLIYNLIFPVLALIFIHCVKTDVDLATATLKECIWFILGGMVFNAYFFKPVENELGIVKEAQHSNRVARRSANL